MPALPGNHWTVEAAGTVKLNKVPYQTTANLNLRTGPGTKYKVILTIPKGKQVTATEKSGSWYKVSYSYTSKGKKYTKTGWVSGSYLKKASSSGSSASASGTTKITKTVYQTTANLNMRTGPGTKYKVILTIPKGKQVTATEKSGNWYKVSYSYTSKGKKYTKTGWVSGSYLKKVPTSGSSGSASGTTKITKTVYQTTANLNMRTGPGTKYKVIFTIPKGKTVSATEKSGSWLKVSYTYTSKGKSYTKTGWVSSSYLKEYNQYINTAGTYYFTTKTANLYSGPNTKSKAASVPKDNGFYSTKKVINSIGQTFYQVSHNGKNLYVHSGDVKKVSPAVFSETKYKANTDTWLYQSPGINTAKLVKIPKDAVISSGLSVASWYKTSYGGKTGFVQAGQFSKYSPGFTETKIANESYLVTDNLNLRQLPDTKSAILVTISKNTIVQPTHKTSNGWFKISYNGKIGYVSGDYLDKIIVPAYSGTIKPYLFLDLRKPSKVTAQQIDQYIAAKAKGNTSVLLNKGKVFIDAGKKYGVNALFLAALAIHESGAGTSPLSLGKNNLFGFGAFDAAPYIAAYRFPSVDEAIYYIAQELKATYLNEKNWKFKGPYLGYKAVTEKKKIRIDSLSTGMNFYYASDPQWGIKIATHMQNILAYKASDYSDVDPNLNVPDRPAIPAGSDVFPPGILAVANSDLTLFPSKKIDAKNQLTIKKGTTFYLLEKTNDYWVKLKYNNKEYWTNSIKFESYRNYISVKNLGRVTATALNIRAGASTNHPIIGSLKQNEYIQIALDSSGKIAKSGNWYQIVLAGGKKGWVSGDYVKLELQ
mgnify:CR=1 FL=1